MRRAKVAYLKGACPPKFCRAKLRRVCRFLSRIKRKGRIVGLVRPLGKRIYRKVSRVRISPLPLCSGQVRALAYSECSAEHLKFLVLWFCLLRFHPTKPWRSWASPGFSGHSPQVSCHEGESALSLMKWGFLK